MFGERPEVDSARSTSPGRPRTLDLPGENLLKSVIVGDGGERGRIGRQGDGGVAGPFFPVTPDDFRGDVLGVGGASAVSDQKHFVSGTERVDDRDSNVAYDCEQRRVIGCALEGRQRLLKMGCDRVLAQDAPLSP